jgi:hypothetical protein
VCHRTVRCTKRSNGYQRNSRLHSALTELKFAVEVRAGVRGAPDSEQWLFGVARDGNGAPFPDPRRGIHPLGDGDGEKILPAGKETGKNQSPSGMAGSGTDNGHPYPLPVGDPI